MSIQVCRDTSDAVALYLPQRLYLKPFAKLNISVQLSPHKVHGKSISNWEVMEKLRKMIQPDCFSMLKVSRHSSDVIRFDAELENREKLERVLSRLEDRVIKLNDYPDPLRVKVSEAKSDYPSRHAWDSFFRDATDMDEMKPGERPDTIHIVNLPIRWFVNEKERDDDAPPSEHLFKKVFEKFGAIRQVDIPAADPFRTQMKTTIRGVTIPLQDSSLYFEAYVQFSEYVGFVRCMDALRGKKLLRKKDDIAEWCDIQVDFDRTKHMTDAAVKRRSIVRDRLVARQRAKQEEERLEKEKLAKREAKERQKQERVEREKLERMREREERRKKKQLAKLMEQDKVDLNSAVAEEDRKLLKAQKKLQALRLMEELLKRIELRSHQDHNGSRQERYYRAGDAAARDRIVSKMIKEQELALDAQRERLKQALDGRIVLRTALETKKPKQHTSSISSISSEEESRQKRIKTEKLTTPEREIEYKKALGMYGLPAPYGYGYPFAACAPGYPYPQTSLYYPGVQGAYYPPPEYVPRGRGRGRGRARGRGRGNSRYDPAYYKNAYSMKDNERGEHDRSRSRSRSRRRSYSRSRSRSRRRSYSRSRSHTRRSRSRSRRRSRSRHSRSRSRSHRRSRSRSRRTRTRSRSKSKVRTPRSKEDKRKDRAGSNTSNASKRRSKSWSLPKEGENGSSWSPKET